MPKQYETLTLSKIAVNRGLHELNLELAEIGISTGGRLQAFEEAEREYVVRVIGSDDATKLDLRRLHQTVLDHLKDAEFHVRTIFFPDGTPLQSPLP